VFLSFGVVLDAILLVLGLVWCREMFGRWRKDLAEFRTAGAGDGSRGALLFLWGVTAIVVLLLVNFAVGILAVVF